MGCSAGTGYDQSFHADNKVLLQVHSPAAGRYAVFGVICSGLATGLEVIIRVYIIPRMVESGLEEMYEMNGAILLGTSAAVSLQMEQKEDNVWQRLGEDQAEDTESP